MLLGRPAARKEARHVSSLRQKGRTARRTRAFLVDSEESARPRGGVARVGEDALVAGQEVAARELGSARSGAGGVNGSAKRVQYAVDPPRSLTATVQPVRRRNSDAWLAHQLSASERGARQYGIGLKRHAAPHRTADGEHGVGHADVAEHAAALCRALLAERQVVLVVQRLFRFVC
jgi:hypothetical protein